MTKQDYSWCFKNDVLPISQIRRPHSCTGFDICGSDGCDYETCEIDCGSDCYTDGCDDCWDEDD